MVKDWNLPIKADWHRATELKSLVFGSDGLVLRLIEENTGQEWELRFRDTQAFKCTTEESASAVLGSLPKDGGFYEIIDSEWLRDLGLGRMEYMSRARHYVICCYDQVVEVVASDHAEPARA